MKSVVTFFGADSKVGITMLTQCLAKQFADIFKDKKTLVLHCDGRPGMDFSPTHDGIRKGIDNLKAKLVSGLLETEELRDCCVNSGNLSILPGVYNFVDRKYYHPELVSVLVKAALAYYDFILIDAGCNLDVGLSIGALLSADSTLLVTTQKSSALKNYEAMEDQVLDKLKGYKKFDALVINEYLKLGGLPQEKQLRQDYGIQKSFSIPWSEFGWQADVEETPLDTLDEIYRNSLKPIINFLAEQMGLDLLQEAPVRSTLLHKIKQSLKGENA